MKKLLGIFMAAVTVIAACVGFVGCNKKDVGELKSLEEAYEAGWLTQEDLKSIAYYYNDQIDEEYYRTNDFYDSNRKLVEYKPSPEAGFIPKPLNPETLSEDTINKIKPFYWTDVFVVSEEYAYLDGVYIEGYYGTYGDCVVIELDDSYTCKYPDFKYPNHMKEIGGVKFYKKTYCPCPYVWRQNNKRK